MFRAFQLCVNSLVFVRRQHNCIISSQRNLWELFYVQRTIYLLHATMPKELSTLAKLFKTYQTSPRSRNLSAHVNLSSIKEALHACESFPPSKNLSRHVNLLLDQETFPHMYSFSLRERKLDYCYHENKCTSCLTTSQLKSQYFRKLKTFKKIYKMLEIIKSSGQLASWNKNFDNYTLKLQKSTLQFFTEWSILLNFKNLLPVF